MTENTGESEAVRAGRAIGRRKQWLTEARDLRRRLDSLGDRIGPNEPYIANVVWAAVGQMDEAVRMLVEASRPAPIDRGDS